MGHYVPKSLAGRTEAGLATETWNKRPGLPCEDVSGRPDPELGRHAPSSRSSSDSLAFFESFRLLGFLTLILFHFVAAVWHFTSASPCPEKEPN